MLRNFAFLLFVVSFSAPAWGQTVVDWSGGNIPSRWQPGMTLRIVKPAGKEWQVVDYVCNRAVTGKAVAGSVGILVWEVYGVRIRSCRVENFSTGIRIHGSNEVWVQDSVILQHLRNGIYATASRGVYLYRNHVYPRNMSNGASDSAGIKIGLAEKDRLIPEYSVYDTNVSENWVGEARDGIDIDGGSGHVVYGNRAWHNARNGIELDFANRCRINGNTAEFNGMHGISVEHVGNVNVYNNTSTNNDVNKNDNDPHNPERRYGKGIRVKLDAGPRGVYVFSNTMCGNSPEPNPVEPPYLPKLTDEGQLEWVYHPDSTSWDSWYNVICP